MSGRARPNEPLATWCEAQFPQCMGRATQRHHKVLRSHGGSDDLCADLCLRCHQDIHENPAWSYEHGWLIRGVT